MARNRFLGGLFETKAKANPKEAVLRSAGTNVGNPMPLGVAGPWDMAKAVQDGLEKVGMVFRCVDVIAQKSSTLPLNLVKMEQGKARQHSTIVDDQDLWKLLNFRSNVYETAQQFRYRLSATALLSRRGAFIEMVPGPNGKPAQLHLLSPGMVEPIPDPEKFVKGYQIMRGDYVVDVVDPERVIWVKIKPHPMDPYQQLTPLMSAGISAQTDFLARIFNRNFLANDGRPGMLVSIQGSLNVQDAEEIKARFSGGVARAGHTSVIEADGLDVVDLAANPRDIQWRELLEMTKQDMLLAFGVPESVMGNASGRTFDNADAERENFYVDTIMPHCDPIANALDAITGDTSDDVVVAFDYSGVDVLQRQEARKREEYRSEFSGGLRTLDSYLKAIGEEPLDVPASRVYFAPAGIPIAKDEKDAEAVAKMLPTGSAAPQPGGSAEAEGGALKGVRQGIAEGNRQQGNSDAAYALRERAKGMLSDDPRYNRRKGKNAKSDDIITETKADPACPYLGLRLKTEGALEGVLAHWDMQQENVVTERLQHVKFRKGTRHWDYEGKSLDGLELKAVKPSYAVDTDQWANELVAGLGDFVRKAMMREARNAARQMKADGLSAPETKAIGALVDPHHEAVLDIIRTAAKNQSKRLEKAIGDMDEAGATLKQIEKKVRQMTGTRAVWRKQLSVNVVTTAVEAARAAVYEQNPRAYTKTWHAERDERTRHTHRKADGQTRLAGNPFTVGGVKMMRPGDPTAPIHEVANCRCWVEYDLRSGK